MPPFDFSNAPGGANLSDLTPCGACAVRGLTICAALEPEELRRLAAITQTHRIEAGATIFNEGDPADALFNVTAGMVKLCKLTSGGRRQITGFLMTGDFLGLNVGGTYAYTAEAVNVTALCRFPKDQMESLLDEFPKLQRRLFSMASNELAAAQDQMLLLGRKSAKEKLASFLLLMSQRAARRGHRDNPLPLPMSRSDIADYLGMTSETVSRGFAQLKADEIVRPLGYNEIELLDMDRLHDLADGG